MQIKTEVKVNLPMEEHGYPCIKISKESGRVILFTSPRRGFILKKDSIYNLGDDYSGWAEEMFVPLRGSVTLTQE